MAVTRALALGMLAALLLPAAGPAAPSVGAAAAPAAPFAGAAAPAAFPMAVVDALGRRVVLAAPPQRIVSVAPSVTEILFALGLDARVVGVSSADDYPPARVASKPRVGGVALDVERILHLRPDLVLGVASLQRGALERLIAMGLPVVAVDAATLDDVYDQIVMIGRMTAAASRAAGVAAAMRSRERAVARAVRGRPRRRVYVELWNEPLLTAGTGTFVSDLVARAGGVNVFDDLAGWPQISEEAVIRRNPEVIVAAYPQGAATVARRGWTQVAAVAAGRVGTVDAALVSRPGPRLADGLLALARLIHPEAFR